MLRPAPWRNRRGVVNLLDRLTSGKGRPAYKAWVAVPVLVSGEWSSTRAEPAKSLYAMVPEVEAMPGVIDAGIWIGYVWGDDRRNQGVVMVYGDDKAQVEAGAKKLAQKFWDVRRQFTLAAPGHDIHFTGIYSGTLQVRCRGRCSYNYINASCLDNGNIVASSVRGIVGSLRLIGMSAASSHWKLRGIRSKNVSIWRWPATRSLSLSAIWVTIPVVAVQAKLHGH